VVFANLLPAIAMGGHLLVTTPNLYRLRNLVRLASGRRVFDYFLVPGPDQPVGHFLEYSQEQLEWHVRKADLQIVESSVRQLTWGGGHLAARLARRAVAPLLAVRPLWRDNLLVLARRRS
jgi:hypothetical protein